MDSYFQTNQTFIDFFPADGLGLRPPQLGAASSLLALSTQKEMEPAIVVLPTGTGKTAVLQLAPFLWRASRVLVITPSRLVREQIVDGFRELALLKKLGVLSEEISSPKVLSIDKRVGSKVSWEDCRDYDVVVATPNSISPSIEGIPVLPTDLFDVLLIDEAHHSPAKSYVAIINALPNAKKGLFTATPFRRDKRKIKGKLAYNYPLKSAIEDQTYGKVEFVPCTPKTKESSDVAIAKLTERTFVADKAAGFNHRVMVRTDSISRAKELKAIYEEHTNLNLSSINGGHGLKHVKQVLKKVESGKIDGIICVDMLAEGVDFPRLKLAALHAPHKSLAITLQFIGRFARTNADEIGTAKFIAVPAEIDSEVQDLYRTSACWEELVANLSDARIEEEESVREGLASFDTVLQAESGEEDLTIDSLNPYFHVKIFKVDVEPDIASEPFVPQGAELVFHVVSEDLSAAVYICKKETKPKWLGNRAIRDVKNYLFIVYYDQFNQLLFINSQEHREDVYESIAEGLYDPDDKPVILPLPHSVISRPLRTLDKAKFYNVGMRNRSLAAQDESYRTLTGPKAHRTISKSDANRRTRGHVYGGGEKGGKEVTIGISAASKIWSNQYELVPLFVGWCKELAFQIANDQPVKTRSSLDMLDTGEPIQELPAKPIFINWHEDVYINPQVLRIDELGEERDLANMDLTIDLVNCNQSIVRFKVVSQEYIVGEFQIDYSTDKKIKRVAGAGGKLTIANFVQAGSLEEYLNIRPPTLYLADFSTVVSANWYRGSNVSALDKTIVKTFDQFGKTVDIKTECGMGADGKQTVHEFTEAQFMDSDDEVVVYDHRSGEVADFISLKETADSVVCRVAHCKAAKRKKTEKATAGSRVDDAYEVAGQIVKCLSYAERPLELKDKLLQRISSGSELKKGSVELMERLLRASDRKQFIFKPCLVQPGISKAKMTPAVESVLAAASEYVVSNAGVSPEIWTST